MTSALIVAGGALLGVATGEAVQSTTVFSLPPELVDGVLAVVGALVTWLVTTIRSHTAQSQQKNAFDWAIAVLGEAADVTMGRLFLTLKPEIQTIFADGKVTTDELATLERDAVAALRGLFSASTLSQLMRALGVPSIEQLGSWVAGYIMRRFIPGVVATQQSTFATRMNDSPTPQGIDPGPTLVPATEPPPVG